MCEILLILTLSLKININYVRIVSDRSFEMGFFSFLKKKKNVETLVPNLENYKLNEQSSVHNGSTSQIRLCYIALEKFYRYGSGEPKIGETICISSPFKLPKNMSLSDACKVISYLSEKVETENLIEPASEASVALVSQMLNDYGFKKQEACEHGHFHSVGDYPAKVCVTHPQALQESADTTTFLFTVGGHFKVFKKSNLYDRYFDWFTPNVTKEEIEKIYDKANANTKPNLSKKYDFELSK